MSVKMTKKDLRLSRITAMQILYNYDVLSENENGVTELIENPTTEFSDSLVNGVLSRLDEIDTYIKQSLTDYTIDRLSFVDRAIVRVATFEFLSKTPAAIVINESLEIVKEFSDTGDGKNKRFMHKLIDTINKNINK